MIPRTDNKGMGWGHGLGLLSLLIIAGLMMYLYAMSLESLSPGTSRADNVYFKVQEQLGDIQDTLNQRAEDTHRLMDPDGLTSAEARQRVALVLVYPGKNEQKVIDIVMNIADIDRAKAKDLVDASPMAVLTDMPRSKAEKARKMLEALGAGVDIRPAEEKENIE